MKITIKSKILVSFIALLLIPVILLSALNFSSISTLSSQNSADSANALISEELANVNRTAVEQASFVSESLNQWASQIDIIAQYSKALFEGNLSFNPIPSYYWNEALEPKTIPNQTVQYSDSAPYFSSHISFDTSAYYLPYSVVNGGVNPLSPPTAIANVINKTAGLDNVFKSIHQANPQWVWLYAQFALPGNVFRNYPFDDMSYFYENEQANASDNFFNSPFYTEALKVGNGNTAFVSPYFDPYVGLIISISEPVYFTNGTLIGVVSGDITMSRITSSITSIKVLEHGYAYLMDKEDNLWAHPKLTEDPQNVLDLEFTNQADKNAFKSILDNISTNSMGQDVFYKNNSKWYISYVHIQISDQVLAIVVPEADIIVPATNIQNTISDLTFVQLSIMAILLLLAMVVIVFLGTIVATRIVKPIKELTNLLDFISKGDLSRDLKEKNENMEKEIGLLHGAFDNLLTSLRFGNKDYYRGDLNRAHQNYLKALELFETTNNQRGIAIAKNNLGNIYRLWGNYGSAKKNYLESIEIGHELNDLKGLASRLNNLAILTLEGNEFDQALGYLNEAITYDQKLENVKGMSIRFSNLGLVYQKMGNYSQALAFYNKGIDSDKHNENKRGLGYGYVNLGNYYLESAVEDVAKSEENLLASLKIAEEFDDVNLALLSLEKLSIVYQRTKHQQNLTKVLKKTAEIRRFIASKKYVYFVIDYSGSMDGVRIRSAVQGALEIYATIINPQDYVGIIIFNSSIRKIQELINVQNNDDAIRRNLKGLRYPTSTTAFYDALGMSLEEMAGIVGNEQKWIISLTDGLDNASRRYGIRSKEPNLLQRLFKQGDNSVQYFIKKNLLNVNLIIVGIGQELERVEGDFVNLVHELPRGKYIPIKEQGQVEKSIAKAFQEVQEMMAQVDIEGFSFDD